MTRLHEILEERSTQRLTRARLLQLPLDGAGDHSCLGEACGAISTSLSRNRAMPKATNDP
jgi:hypothetical protein